MRDAWSEQMLLRLLSRILRYLTEAPDILWQQYSMRQQMVDSGVRNCLASYSKPNFLAADLKLYR